MFVFFMAFHSMINGYANKPQGFANARFQSSMFVFSTIVYISFPILLLLVLRSNISDPYFITGVMSTVVSIPICIWYYLRYDRTHSKLLVSRSRILSRPYIYTLYISMIMLILYLILSVVDLMDV